jgi:hypothetical protein
MPQATKQQSQGTHGQALAEALGYQQRVAVFPRMNDPLHRSGLRRELLDSPALGARRTMAQPARNAHRHAAGGSAADRDCLPVFLNALEALKLL